MVGGRSVAGPSRQVLASRQNRRRPAVMRGGRRIARACPRSRPGSSRHRGAPAALGRRSDIFCNSDAVDQDMPFDYLLMSINHRQGASAWKSSRQPLGHTLTEWTASGSSASVRARASPTRSARRDPIDASPRRFGGRGRDQPSLFRRLSRRDARGCRRRVSRPDLPRSAVQFQAALQRVHRRRAMGGVRRHMALARSGRRLPSSSRGCRPGSDHGRASADTWRRHSACLPVLHGKSPAGVPPHSKGNYIEECRNRAFPAVL